MIASSTKKCLTALCLTTLLTCSSDPVSVPEPGFTNPNDGRYAFDQDRAPLRPIDINLIPEIIPQPVQRTLAGNRSPYTILGKTYQIMSTEAGYNESGIASWYGEKFHGHDTSNGEVFDMYQATAAHKTLPLPSFLRVTNLDNNRAIIVRVNDRGPFHGDRIIDLSYAAALKLGYAHIGTARVQLESIVVAGQFAENNAVGYPQKYLQVGAFSDLRTAEQVSSRVREFTDQLVFIREIENASSPTLYRVRVGPVSEWEIQEITEQVVAANLGSPYTVSE